MTTRWGTVAAAALGAVLVAVPAGAATVITSKQIKNETIVSADVKNGSLKAQDLTAALRRSPATRYNASTATAPGFATTAAPTAGDTDGVAITTTRTGDLLLLGGQPISFDQFIITNSAYTMQTALYLDGKVVAGTVRSVASCEDPGIGCRDAFDNLEVQGVVIRGVPAGAHTLALRFFGTVSGTMTVTYPTFTVVELG